MCSVKVFPNLEAALKGVFNRVLTKLSGFIAIPLCLKNVFNSWVLTELRLGYNKIGDERAKAIAEALKRELGQRGGEHQAWKQ